MGIFTYIVEGGVETAQIDKAARKALRDRLPKIIDGMVEIEMKRLGVERPDTDDPGEFYSNLYDDLYQHYRKDPQTFEAPLARQVTDILQRVTSDEIERRALDVKNRNLTSNPGVSVECKDLSDDDYRHRTAGYFMEWQNLFKVFIDRDKVFHAGMGMIQENLFGEDPEGYLDQMLAAIVPTFVHEFAHYIQAANRKALSRTSDHGYTLNKVKGRGRSGQRGGSRRDHEKNPAAYLASAKEIDSFASGAAAEIVQEFRRYRYGDEDGDINTQIKSALDDLAQGYANIDSVNYYTKYLRDILDGLYGETTLRTEEYEVIYKRFLKRVYEKLSGYMSAQHGKASTYHSRKMNPKWVAAAKKLPLARMARDLAMEAADEIAKSERYWGLEDQIRQVNTGYCAEIEARETFLVHYYIGDDYWDKREVAEKINAAFRQLVIARLRKLDGIAARPTLAA